MCDIYIYIYVIQLYLIITNILNILNEYINVHSLVTTRVFIYSLFIFHTVKFSYAFQPRCLAFLGGVGGGGTYIRHVCEVCFYFKYVYCRFS